MNGERTASGHEAGVQGFVLAGGRSSRMGTDKALAMLHGQPLIAHALGIQRGAGLPASIVGGSPELAAWAPLVADRWPGLGPLGGICSGLAAMTEQRWAVFTSVDMPLLPSSLLSALARRATMTGEPIVMASVSGVAQTFPVVVDRVVLPYLADELASGRRGCFAALERAASQLGHALTPIFAELLAEPGQASHPGGLAPFRWFTNLNTPEDLRQAGAVLSRIA